MSKRLEGLRVLLVEDNWIVASSLQSLLEPMGVRVVGPAATLSDATRIVATTAIDVAVMDLDLHGERTDALIAALHTKRIPVIIISGNTAAPTTAANAVVVLSKPYRSGHLLDALRHLRRSPAEVAAA